MKRAMCFGKPNGLGVSPDLKFLGTQWVPGQASECAGKQRLCQSSVADKTSLSQHYPLEPTNSGTFSLQFPISSVISEI